MKHPSQNIFSLYQMVQFLPTLFEPVKKLHHMAAEKAERYLNTL